jgi:hypothetical protein
VRLQPTEHQQSQLLDVAHPTAGGAIDDADGKNKKGRVRARRGETDCRVGGVDLRVRRVVCGRLLSQSWVRWSCTKKFREGATTDSHVQRVCC